jgi:hypothetical protein
MVGNVRLS